MLIVGAGGCASDLLAMLDAEGKSDGLVFYDDVSPTVPDLFFGRFTILRSLAEAAEHLRTDPRFVVAVGGPEHRKALMNRFEGAGGKPISIISKNAVIGAHSIVSDRGVIIMHGVIITHDVRIGEGCLINMGCIIGHGARIGDHCELSPGVMFSNSTVGNCTHLGIGSKLVPGVRVGERVQVGVGAIVTADVPDDVTVVGIPARPII
jgi:sugar O-acyltransferase (sialic acid O-acetyltransferase NeuD family)